VEEQFDLVVVGGGAIGLSCAWRAARDGLRVCVLERAEPGRAATHAAAGILAPDLEAEPGAAPLAALGRHSLDLWPAFAAELEEATGRDVGFERCGTLLVAFDRDELESVDWERELLARMGLEARHLTASECRALEPGLAPSCAGGLLSPHEAQVDPRRLAAALVDALAAAGGELRAGAEARALAGGAVLLADGSRVRGERVLLAAGAWTGEDGLVPRRLPVRPVKGQIVRLRGPRPAERMIRSERVYVVPRATGEVVVGATVEERGFDTAVTAGGVLELLREAYRALPEIAELELVEVAAGLRPGSPDNAPLLGEVGDDGLLVASGHYRNGILLAPATAEAIGALLRGEPAPGPAAPFAPGRFAS
jgi:glycine oxidase